MRKLNRLFVLACTMLLVASCGKKVNITLTSNDVVFAPEGSTAEVSLYSNGDWSVDSSLDWVTVTPTSGNGDDILKLTASANDSGESRLGTIKVSTKDSNATLTVTQSPMAAFLTVRPEEIECGSQGGAFDVEVQANVDWQLSVLPSWITASATSGSNDGHVVLTVAPITDEIAGGREATLSFTGEDLVASLHVKQSEAGVTFGFSIAPIELGIGYQGGTETLILTTTLAWTATTEADWITIAPATGNGDAEVTINVAENPEHENREANIRFDYTFPDASSGNTFVKVRQEAAPVQHILTVSPHEIHFGMEGGTAEINVECDTKWGIETQTSWIALSEYNGMGNATLVLTVEPNVIVEPRSFVLRFGSEAELSESVIVTQDAGEELPTVTLSPDTLFVSYLGAVATLNITSNVAWQLESPNDWVMMLNNSGSGDASRDIIVYENRTGATRYGEVRAMFGGQVMSRTVIVQESMPIVLETDITEITADREGGTYTINVTSSLNWMVSKGAYWLQYSPTSGSGNGQIVVTVDPMMSSHPRSAEIYITGDYDTQVVIVVSQSN